MKYLNYVQGWCALCLMFCRELCKSVYDVVLNVLNPARVPASAIIEVPLTVQSELGVALLANMVTLTPGTTTLYVSEDQKTMYVHVMRYSSDAVSDIQQGFERQILKVLT